MLAFSFADFLKTFTIALAIAIVIIAFTWIFARSFFFRIFTAVLRSFSQYVTRLQSASTGAQVLDALAAYLQPIFPQEPRIRIVVWFAFNRKTMPLSGYNLDRETAAAINTLGFRTELAKISGPMLVDSELVVDEDVMPTIAAKLPHARRLFSYPFVHRGSLFGIVHVFLPRTHVGFRRRSLSQLYAQVARARFIQLAAERDTLRIASDIGAIERSFEALIDTAPVGMVICETDLSIRYMNETAGNLLEATPRSQAGTLLLSHFTDAQQRKMIAAMASKIIGAKNHGKKSGARRSTSASSSASPSASSSTASSVSSATHTSVLSDQVHESRFNFISASNTHRYFDIESYPIRSSSGKILELVFVFRDNTKRYLLEEELAITQKEYQTELEDKVRIATRELVSANKELTRLSALKSEFVSTISHELRTPLTSIIGYLSLLESKRLGPLTAKQKQSIQILSEESNRLASLINDILDLSRLEANKSTLHITQVPVDALIQKVITTLQPLIAKKNLNVTFEHPYPISIAADAAKLQQILTNILSNAIKFTQPKKRIQVRLLKDSHSCIISVLDQGIGISAKDIPHIFESFHRSEQAMTNAIKGTGLGLPIVKHLVDQHKGKITVQSHLGRGTRVTLILPLKQR